MSRRLKLTLTGFSLAISLTILTIVMSACSTQGSLDAEEDFGTKTVLLPSGREAECVFWDQYPSSAGSEQMECFIVPEDLQLPTLPLD